VRPNADHWKLADGRLYVRAQPGRIWAGNDAVNILLCNAGAGKAAVGVDGLGAEVIVQHEGGRKYEQAGLLLYIDDDNFVKLISEHIDGKAYVVLAREDGRQRRVESKIAVPSLHMRLRLEVRGKRITAKWKPLDINKPWAPAGKSSFDAKGKRRFGLFNQDGPKDAVRWIRFDEFRIEKL